MEAARPPFFYTLPVRFADTDAQGHVYFANYLTFCDEALSAYLRLIGFPWQQLVESGVDMFYRSARCDFRGSATFEQAVVIETRVARVGNTSIVSSYIVRGPGDAVLAEAALTSVCVDAKTRDPVRVPDELREAITRFEGARLLPE